MNFRQPLFAGCALMALAMAGPALAQPPATRPPADEATLVDEIIVTTERRAQSLQDVPLAITAIDADMRENAGILTIQDMTQFTPGFSYNTTTDSPSIRGIGRQSNTFSLDSPVANYFDGVYTSSVQDASRRPIFIERTEILRGPQGALSGRGSIAGAVNTISKLPDDEFGGAIGVGVANYERYLVEGTVTGPVTDWLQYRFNVGHYRQHEGFFHNVANGGNEGDQPNNRNIYDLLFTAQFGENFDGFLKLAFADYYESRRTTASLAPYIAGNDPCLPAIGGGAVPSAAFGFFQPGIGCGLVSLPVTGAPAGTRAAFDPNGLVLGGVTTNPVTSRNLRVYNTDYSANQRLDNHHNYTAHLTWHGPSFDVKWIGGHQNYRYTQFTDADGTPVREMTIGAYVNPTTLVTRRVDPSGINMYQEEREWYSNEINIASTTDGPLQWIVGLYESNEQYEQTPQATFYRGFPELNQPNFALLAPAGPIAPNAVPFRQQYGHLIGETISRAAYAHVDWQASDQWKFSLGVRVNKDEKEVEEDARFLAVRTAAADIVTPGATDNTFAFFRGYSLVNSATAVVPAGYRLVNIDQFPLNAAGTARVLPDGSTAPLLTGGAPTALLFAPGVVGFPFTDPVTGARHRNLAGDWDAVTGSLGVDYAPNEDTLIYARIARGFRPGGFNSGFINAVPQVEEEYVNSYEVGTKLTLSGQLRANVAAFLYDYEDIQLPLPIFDRCTVPGDFTTCTALNSFINLPSAENKGIELEGIWMPTDNWQFIFSYGYLDAKIKNGLTTLGFEHADDPAALLPTAQRHLPITCVLAINPTTGENIPTATCGRLAGEPLTTNRGHAIDATTLQGRWTQDLSGNSLTNSPKHKFSVNANYTFRDVLNGDITVSGSYIWRDEAKGDLFGSTVNTTPSYDQVNLRAIYRGADDKYQVILWVQNVLDEDVAETFNGIRRSVAGPGTGQIYYPSYNLAPPRTFGLEVQRRF